MNTESKQYATPEQLVYANILDWGMKIGFVALLVTFFLYVFQIIPPHIPVEELSKYWGMPVSEYLVVANVHIGWSWLDLAHKGDFMNFVGIVFLASVTILCYLGILPILLKNKDIIYVWIAILEILVLVLAASGILAVGH